MTQTKSQRPRRSQTTTTSHSEDARRVLIGDDGPPRRNETRALIKVWEIICAISYSSDYGAIHPKDCDCTGCRAADGKWGDIRRVRNAAHHIMRAKEGS